MATKKQQEEETPKVETPPKTETIGFFPKEGVSRPISQ